MGWQDAPEVGFTVPKWQQAPEAQPTDRQELLSSAPMRLAKGGKDQIDGAAQVARWLVDHAVKLISPTARAQADAGGPSPSDYVDRAANAIGGEGTFLGDVLGVKGASQEQLRTDIKDSNTEYEDARKATAPGGKPGFDAMRLAGNIASPANVLPMKAAPAVRAADSLGRIALKSAVGGAAGAMVQPSTGENFLVDKAEQAGLGAAGGAVLGPVLTKAGDSAARFVDRWRSSRGAVNVDPERLREMVRAQLRTDGVDVTTIPDAVFEGITNDVRGALANGRRLDPTAALRQADFDAVGIPSTRGQVTRDPAQWQREFNLAGVEGAGEPLAQRFAQQTRGINNRFDTAAAGAAEPFTAGEQMIGQLQAANQTSENNVRAAYQAFRNSTGRDLDVPLSGLAQDYATTLRDFGDKIPGAVRNQFEELGLLGGTQRRALTIDDAERLIKVINGHYNPADRASANALDQLRGSLQRAVTGAADTAGTGAGAEAAHLASEARGLASQRFQTIENTPALRAALTGAQPDDFVARFILRGKVGDIQNTLGLLDPEGRQQAAAQTVRYLQQKAFGSNVAGDGKAAQAAFNKELLAIGRPKLVALLGEDGANEMFRLGRVLAYIKQVPEGATPNTSGTGQMITSMLGKAKGLQGLPYVNDWLVKPLARYGDRREVAGALAGAPTQAAEANPQTVEAVRRLFAPAAVGTGALSYPFR